MKILTWIIFTALVFASLFKFKGAELNNNVVAVSLMILLVTLFSDLKEFNFWGLRGKKADKNQLKKLEGEKALPETKKKLKKAAFVQAQSMPVALAADDKTNFLNLAFEIERLLRIYATASAAKDIPSTISPEKLTEDMLSTGLLTESGAAQLKGVRWLRNIFVTGRDSEITSTVIRDGLEIAESLYNELHGLMYSNSQA